MLGAAAGEVTGGKDAGCTPPGQALILAPALFFFMGEFFPALQSWGLFLLPEWKPSPSSQVLQCLEWAFGHGRIRTCQRRANKHSPTRLARAARCPEWGASHPPHTGGSHRGVPVSWASGPASPWSICGPCVGNRRATAAQQCVVGRFAGRNRSAAGWAGRDLDVGAFLGKIKY